MPGRKKRTSGMSKKDRKAGVGGRKMGCCRGLLPHLTDFIEGDACEPVCRRIRSHLDGCKTCRMHVDAQAGVVGLYKTWRDGTAPPAAKVRLRKALDRVMTGEER